MTITTITTMTMTTITVRMMTSKDSSSALSLLAALVIGVTGLIPVAWLLTSPTEQTVAEEEAVVVETTTTTSPEATTVIVEEVPSLDVDELDPAVVRVLQANGYADLAAESEIGGELPEAVTQVLIDRGAVLTVVEDNTQPGEG